MLGRRIHGKLQRVAADPMDVRLCMLGLFQEKHYQVDKGKILLVGEHGVAEKQHQTLISS